MLCYVNHPVFARNVAMFIATRELALATLRQFVYHKKCSDGRVSTLSAVQVHEESRACTRDTGKLLYTCEDRFSSRSVAIARFSHINFDHHYLITTINMTPASATFPLTS